MKITVDLTLEESAEIKSLAICYGTTPKQILTQFASDITESLRTHGSDERDLAEQYVARTFLDRRASYCPKEEALSDKEKEKISRLHSESWRHRQDQLAALG